MLEHCLTSLDASQFDPARIAGLILALRISHSPNLNHSWICSWAQHPTSCLQPLLPYCCGYISLTKCSPTETMVSGHSVWPWSHSCQHPWPPFLLIRHCITGSDFHQYASDLYLSYLYILTSRRRLSAPPSLVGIILNLHKWILFSVRRVGLLL